MNHQPSTINHQPSTINHQSYGLHLLPMLAGLGVAALALAAGSSAEACCLRVVVAYLVTALLVKGGQWALSASENEPVEAQPVADDGDSRMRDEG